MSSLCNICNIKIKIGDKKIGSKNFLIGSVRIKKLGIKKQYKNQQNIVNLFSGFIDKDYTALSQNTHNPDFKK